MRKDASAGCHNSRPFAPGSALCPVQWAQSSPDPAWVPVGLRARHLGLAISRGLSNLRCAPLAQPHREHSLLREQEQDVARI